MRIGPYDFHPSLGITLLTLALVPCFVVLGLWQLDRGMYRAALHAEAKRSRMAPPILLQGMQKEVTDLRFRRIKVTGVFDKPHMFLLDNAVYMGQAGYYVMTPLRISGGEIRVLVNRGWIPMGPRRNNIPPIDTPDTEISLTGYVQIPTKQRFTMGGDQEIKDTWPIRWPYLDLDRLQSAVPYPIQAFVLLQDETSPHGYLRQWTNQFYQSKSVMNYGYAVQWFSFGLIILITYIVKNTRKITTAKNSKTNTSEVDSKA